ncbi:hypothetical protein RX717_06265 [Intestinibacillus sp. NTUH-41-i26]|nr:hypothetical protein [Intestinibacillus sp. NTUH-41-i26]WOC76956.1 hypothetical protein RX717_06265 [Intestinibacillus sp. NTUH-41-i26]
MQLMDHCSDLFIRQRLYVRFGDLGEITDISRVISQIAYQHSLL